MKRLKTKLVNVIAHTKVIMFYGAETLYPVFTLFTAVGVAKIAFGIPTLTAALIMGGAVFGLGLLSFLTGIFSRDLDIKWRNTPSAKDLCERVQRIEELLK